MIHKATLHNFPEAHPGKCIHCNNSTRHDGRQYVDFGINILRYGAVYWCTKCLAEVTGILGWITPDKAKELHLKIETQSKRIKDLEEDNARLCIALNNLDFVSSIYPTISPPVEAISGSEDSIPESDNKPIDTSERRKKTEIGSSESSNESGSTDVYGDESSDGISSII
jgi:hypothetical protein